MGHLRRRVVKNSEPVTTALDCPSVTRPSRRREECLLRNSTSINAHLTKLRPSRLPLDMLHESITSFSQYLSLLVCTTSSAAVLLS